MRKAILLILMLCLMVFFLEAGDFPVKQRKTIKKELTFAGGTQPQTLEIDNVFGSIKVLGYNGDIVKVTAQKTIRAETNETLQQAKTEVKLDISSKGNTIIFFVNGPFRTEKGSISWNARKIRYIVQYDFEVNVPHKTGLRLKTVNDGNIYVSDINGDFGIRNVNGRIKMEKINGSGKAHTVNGKVAVLFNKNPGSNCSFHTINGNLEVTFLPGLSADFKLKTFNGKIYSDFPTTYLPPTLVKGERKKGKYGYKSSRFQGVRIGSGGPTIKMDTLNGNILISKVI